MNALVYECEAEETRFLCSSNRQGSRSFLNEETARQQPNMTYGSKTLCVCIERSKASTNSAWYSCSSITFAVQASGILGKFDPCRCFRIRGCQNTARLECPQICKAGKSKTLAGIEFPQHSKNLGICRERGAIVAEIWKFCGNSTMAMFSQFQL